MEKYLSCNSYTWLCINFGKEDETRNDTIKKFSVIIGVRTQQKQKFRSHLDLWPSKPATFKLPVLFRKFYHRPICHRCSGGGEMALRDIFCSNVFNLWKMVSSRAKAMSKSFFSQSWRPWNEQARPHITGFERPLRRLSTQASAEAHHSKLRCYCHSWWRFFGLAFLSLNLTGNLLLDVRHSTPLFFIFLIGAKETEEERKYAIASSSW